MTALIKRKQIESFSVDSATTISNYNFATKDYNIVEGFINGEHGTMMNKTSTKSYYIISGTGTFEIDDKIYHVEEGDIISVKPKSWLKIIGNNLKVLIISNPIFNPADESWK